MKKFSVALASDSTLTHFITEATSEINALEILMERPELNFDDDEQNALPKDYKEARNYFMQELEMEVSVIEL
ncbi:hypothetical protein MA9V2_079 [Chryseobacterium phage MA9V-2]|nr:hypothetical protein MA9V2_079 [Chryseobacterium phage MA9V-2]